MATASLLPYRQALSLPGFRALWLADAQSTAGDQLARVALSLMVFDRTGSAIWTAMTYALTYAPDLAGNMLLSWIADAYPRRTVMVASSIVQAILVGSMAVPGLPLPVLALLVAISTACLSPVRAAQLAIIPDLLPGAGSTRAGVALMDTTRNVAQLLGLGAGAALVDVLSTRTALLIDAATFACAALLLLRWLPWAPDAGGKRQVRGQLTDSFRAVATSPRLAALVSLAWIATIVVAPEGIVAPLTAELGSGRWAVGVLLGIQPLMLIVGLAVVVGRVAERHQDRALSVLVLLSVLPLIGFLFHPGLIVSIALLGLSGLGSGYFTLLKAQFLDLVAPSVRGSVSALIRSGIQVGAGIGLAVGGVLTRLLGSAGTAIGVLGLVGLVWATIALRAWHTNRSEDDR